MDSARGWAADRIRRVRRGSWSGAAVLLAAALAMSLPAVVQGDEEGATRSTAFRLQASNGYEFIVEAGAPPEGEEGWIGIFLLHGMTAAATYAAPATVSRNRIDADLGELGTISVKRVRTGRTKTVRKCQRGPKVRVEAERYEGTIEFHGEEGFAEVDASRAPVVELPECGVIPEGGRPPRKILPGARLAVHEGISEGDEVNFDAVQERPGKRTVVSAETEEHRGEMEIHRAVGMRASASALTFDPHLRNATITLPAPFAGHASFHRGARGPDQWTGNLTVDLPGRAEVPVTGPGFSVDLERPRR